MNIESESIQEQKKNNSELVSEESAKSKNLSAQAKAEWLINNIKISIKHTSQNKHKNRRKASTIKIATIALSGVATILLGLQIVGWEKYFKEIAFVLGAIVTLINALEPFFNYRSLWVEHEVALADFHRLQDELDYRLSGTELAENKIEELDTIHAQYQGIWKNLNHSWIGYRKIEPK